MTKEEIIRQAMLLGDAIASSEELAGLRQAQQEVSSDMASYQMIVKYQQARASADSKLRQGLSLSPEEENELTDLEKMIRENEKVQNLIKRQEEFDNLMQSVYFIMNQAITGPSCTGSCSGCSSCS